MQMASLQDMINFDVLKIGDTIEFTFKGNVFRAKILRGGIIGKCLHKSIHENDFKTTLQMTVGFSSLTAWTECCLQDVLEEYYTRYSSWKRVYHRESKRSMSDLRDQCKLKDTKRKQEDIVELYKEIFRLQGTIDEMNQYISKMHNGQANVKQWSYMHIEPQTKDIPIIKKVKHRYYQSVSSRAQDAICDNTSQLNTIVTDIIHT